MSAFTTSVLLAGRSIPAQTPVRLRAGPLTMLFDPTTGFLRQIKRVEDAAPVLNGIYAAVRDCNWGTVEPEIRDLRIDQQPQSFTVGFFAECRQGEIQFVWRGQIAGAADGTILYTFDGEAESDFMRNRIGLCVLHGAECAGRACVIEHVDGTRAESVFPKFIAPGQPFQQIRAVTHYLGGRHSCRPGEEKNGESPEMAEGTPLPFRSGGGEDFRDRLTTRIEVRLEGAVFEMEDQRNWTDASFKTYCTPLELPFPVPVRKGETFHQSVDLRPREERHFCRPGDPSAGPGDRNLALPMTGPFHPLPRLGLGMASHDLPLNNREVELLKRLQLDHLRCDLTPLVEGWETRWHEAVRQVRALNTRLHVALHLDDRAREQIAAVSKLPATELVDAWLTFHRGEKATSSQWTRLAREQLAGGGGLIVGGTDANFAELNRHRPAPGSSDAITWSINPQVHAFDNRSLVETLDTQWETVVSARAFWAGAMMVSPVTLRPRFNPNATAGPRPVTPDVLPPEVDVRQMSLFGAAWTLGSIASLSRAPGLRSITYYETTGWRGVLEWSERPRLPHKFVTRPNWVFPTYHVLALIGGFDECRRVAVADPLRQTAMMVRDSAAPHSARLLAASFDPEFTSLLLPPGFTPVRTMGLAQANCVAAMRDPGALLDTGWADAVTSASAGLPPFGLLAIDGRLG